MCVSACVRWEWGRGEGEGGGERERAARRREDSKKNYLGARKPPDNPRK